MKKLVVAVLCISIFMLSMMPFALAVEVKPGDTITVTVEIVANPNNMQAIKVNLNYPDILVPKGNAIAGFSGWSKGANGQLEMRAVKVGETVQVEFTVKTDAPDGSYNIGINSIEGIGTGAKATLSNNSFTVKSNPTSASHTHTWGDWKETKATNCTETGTKERVCSECKEVEKETIPVDSTKHDWSTWKETKAATCTDEGKQERNCSRCGKVESKEIPAKGHDWGEWVTTKEPAIGVAGLETRTCKNDSTHKDTRTIAALSETPCEHDHTSERVRVEGSCTEQKEVDIVCDDCGAIIGTEYGPKPAGHVWGDWEITKPAAPGVEGEETRVCKNDPAHTETRKIPALPVDDPTTPPVDDPTNPPIDDPACTHPSISWKKTKTASCTEPGETQRTCDICGEVFETEIVPPMGHDDGEWVVVEKPTQTKNGLKQLQCTRCHEVLKEEIIDRMTTEWRYNQSVCSLGIRFRNIKPELTKKWFMFTPIDLSKDGIQTIDLIAANITYAGKVTLRVQDGKVTVNYKVNWPMEKKDMAFTLLPDLDSVGNVDMDSMKTYSFGEEISVADDLNGDTNVLLYVLGHINYDFQDTRNEFFTPNDAKYQNLVTELKDLMD